jgi:hypothetical protein
MIAAAMSGILTPHHMTSTITLEPAMPMVFLIPCPAAKKGRGRKGGREGKRKEKKKTKKKIKTDER